MKLFLSINKLYTFLLLLFPSLIAVSWINVFLGNAHYTILNYTLTFVLPALVMSYAASLITAESLNEGYKFTLGRVVFTFIALLGGLYAFSLVFNFFGFYSLFLTAPIPSVIEYDKIAVLGTSTQVDPRETASKFYSAELLFPSRFFPNRFCFWFHRRSFAFFCWCKIMFHNICRFRCFE